MKSNNKIIFLGVKRVGLIALECFIKLVEVELVITTDNVENKELLGLAKKHNIPTYINPDFKNSYLINSIKNKNIDTAISVSYPRIIPEIFFKIFKNGMYNFHPAKLPNYRGNFPTMWPILNGDKYASYTLHLIDKGIDTGPIINIITIKIDKKDTGWSLYQKLINILPSFINQSIDSIFLDNKKYYRQNSKDAKYYSKDIPNDRLIDLSWNASYIVDFVRALYSPIHNSAYLMDGQNKIEIMQAEHLLNIDNYQNNSKNYIIFQCSQGFIRFKKKLQHKLEED